jgi:acetolactate decarboxylase
MIMNKNKEKILLLIFLCFTSWSFAQRAPLTEKPITNHSLSIKKTLYQFGHADAFVNGVYQGILNLRELQQHGDFGLGAPDQVDGELTMHQGKLYQTTADGKTRRADDQLKMPFAFVTTFNPDKIIHLEWSGNLQALYEKLRGLLSNLNGMYAIRLSGDFSTISTRAFPPFKKGDHTPLAEVLDRQQIFRVNNIPGTLIGFYLPGYLAGTNIAGFHFHFLSADLTKGGHLLELQYKGTLQVELAQLDDFLLEMPKAGSFLDFPFNKANKADLEKVEKGSK